MLHQFASFCLNHDAILQEIWKQFIRPTQPINVLYWADGKLLRWILNQSDDSKDSCQLWSSDSVGENDGTDWVMACPKLTEALLL